MKSLEYKEGAAHQSRLQVFFRLQTIWHWQYLGLFLLVLFTLGLHFGTIMHPNTYVFDEIYYVSDANSIIAHNGTLVPEHPPLGKLFIVEGIRLFGDNPMGWRFFSIIFGTLSIILLYLICRRLKMSNLASLLVAALFATENLSFIMASVAMLDVFCLTFMLAAVFFYLRSNFLLAGIFIGMSALAKLPGISVLAVIFLFWLLTDRKRWQPLIITVALTVISFLALMPLLDYVLTSQFMSPIEHVRNMLNYAVGVVYTNLPGSVFSYPWEWLMNRGSIFVSPDPQYILMVSFTISILAIPSILYMIYRVAKRDPIPLWALLWFVCNYIPWVFIVIIFHRSTYVYYMYPVIVSICPGIGLGLYRIWEYYRKNKESKLAHLGVMAVVGYLVIHLVIFVLLSPLMPSLVSWIPI